MSTLSCQRRHDVDRRIRNDQGFFVRGHVHHEAVTDAPGRAQAALAADHRGHQFIGVQAALHQRFGLTVQHEFDRLFRGGVAVRNVDDRVGGNVHAGLARGLADPLLRTDKDRLDQAEPCGTDRTVDRSFIAWVHHRGRHRRQAATGVQQALVFGVIGHGSAGVRDTPDCRCCTAIMTTRTPVRRSFRARSLDPRQLRPAAAGAIRRCPSEPGSI